MADWQKVFIKQVATVTGRITPRGGTEYLIEIYAREELLLRYSKAFETENAAMTEADERLAHYGTP